MHNPRGSNNRLNEATANRQNADRLFDSQNNNRGGYNVGDSGKAASSRAETDTNALYDFSTNTPTSTAQYSMMFYEGSILNVEWTNQHGCGGREATDPHQQNCDIILQYMCETTDNTANPATDKAMHYIVAGIHDGTATTTPTEPQTITDVPNANNAQNGRHEPESFYYECKRRNRNNGLFTADQRLAGNSAIFTRQNPNGNRRIGMSGGKRLFSILVTIAMARYCCFN